MSTLIPVDTLTDLANARRTLTAEILARMGATDRRRVRIPQDAIELVKGGAVYDRYQTEQADRLRYSTGYHARLSREVEAALARRETAAAST